MNYRKYLQIPTSCSPCHASSICNKNIKLVGDINVVRIVRDKNKNLPAVDLDFYYLELSGSVFYKSVSIPADVEQYNLSVDGGKIIYAEIKPDCNYTETVFIFSGSVQKPPTFTFNGGSLTVIASIWFATNDPKLFSNLDTALKANVKALYFSTATSVVVLNNFTALATGTFLGDENTPSSGEFQLVRVEGSGVLKDDSTELEGDITVTFDPTCSEICNIFPDNVFANGLYADFRSNTRDLNVGDSFDLNAITWATCSDSTPVIIGNPSILLVNFSFTNFFFIFLLQDSDSIYKVEAITIGGIPLTSAKLDACVYLLDDSQFDF